MRELTVGAGAMPGATIAGEGLAAARVLDAIGLAVIATRLDGTICYWSPFAETLYGWSASEVLGRNIDERE